MFGGYLKRPALGQVASLGTLYDARSDTFMPLSTPPSNEHSFLRGSPSARVITTTNIPTSDVKLSRNDTYKDKFDHMGIGPELGASFLAGLIGVEESGCYLNHERDGNLGMQASLHYNITTVHEKLEFGTGEVKVLAFKKLEGSATHVVAEITWGARCIVTAKHQLSGGSDDRTEIEGRFEAELEALSIPGGADSGKGNEEDSLRNPFEVTVYSDVVADDGLLPTDFDSAHKFISSLPRYIAGVNNGKGKPLVYALLPLGILPLFLPIEIKSDIAIAQPSVEFLEKFFQLFDELRSAQQTLKDYYSRVENHTSCVPAGHIRMTAGCIESVRAAEADLKLNYASSLKDVRAGKADAQQLSRLLERFYSRDSTPEKTSAAVSEYTEKVKFFDTVIAEGAKYIGYGSHTLEEELMANPCEESYVFYFNEDVRQECISWDENVALLLELLRDTECSQFIVVVDCDATGQVLEKPYISHIRNGQIVTNDLAEQRSLLADNCIIRYHEQHLDRLMIERPLKRGAVKIPCPGLECSPEKRCDWICFECFVPVEYSYLDQYLYCECGRSPYKYSDFKCNEPKHGPGFEKYDESKLSLLLELLEPRDEINILILGETGVGKSTFINAFVNYLTFSSMDEAMSLNGLNCIIPCSFSTQYVDKDDPNSRLVQKEVCNAIIPPRTTAILIIKQIKIGSSKDESHGVVGQSATQRTAVYPVQIGSYSVRLIDTPGIGDTRGVKQDRENMVNILSVLRNYDKIHGILILLKPNNSRLTVTFRFCIKELLTHLHRDAANNMVFGFTNTRGSNYQPGDTFKPLESLLSKYEDTNIGLFRHTVYCFDSESFRYLAAKKQGVDMGNLQDYRRSWEQSATESERLISYFRSLVPHDVKSTLGMNETRHLITQLTKPMADLGQSIDKSISVNNDRKNELSTKQHTAGELRGKLHVQKITMRPHTIDRPRTVCAHSDCIELHDLTMDGTNTLTTVYKTICHNGCYLTNIKEDQVGAPGLIQCDAFRGKKKCFCGHHWREHLHIMYEFHPEIVEMKDFSVEKALLDNADVIKVKEAAIEKMQKTIDEYKYEQEAIQRAAVQFGFFLKNNSITAYNDAMLEYLDLQIKDAKAKVQIGGNLEHLDRLERYRAQYKELINVLTSSMHSDEACQLLSQEDVEQKVKELYKLKHYGRDLRKNRDFVERSQAVTHREKTVCMPLMNRRPNARPRDNQLKAKSSHGSRSAELWGKIQSWIIST